MNITPELFMAAAALIGVGINLWRTRRMTSHEEASTDASAAKTFAEAADLTASRAVTLENRIAAQDIRIATQNEELRTVREEFKVVKVEMRRRDIYIAYLLGGITALHKQMSDDGMVPCWSPETMDKQVP